MTTLTALVQLAHPAQGAPAEKRSSPRHPSAQAGVSRVAEDPGAFRWGARVRDVSERGLGLLVCYPFKAGTLLIVEMHTWCRNHNLQARVVRATDQKDGTWLVGCELTGKLSTEEVAALR